MSKQTNKELFLGGFVKVLKEQQKEDVMLKALDSGDENAPISAHKLLLCARSEIFKKMLESDDECNDSSTITKTITLSDLKHEELVSFVEFLYSDGSMLSEKAKEHVRSLYVAAENYEIPHLRDLCTTQLEVIDKVDESLVIDDDDDATIDLSNEFKALAVNDATTTTVSEPVVEPKLRRSNRRFANIFELIIHVGLFVVSRLSLPSMTNKI